MNNRAKKLSIATLAAVGLCVFTGCIDNNYDLNDVDMTVGIGNGELQLPSCSTDRIQLDEVLKLNNSKTVVERENGDYYYLQDGNEVNATHTKVNTITVVKQKGEMHDFNFSLAQYVGQGAKHTRATSIPVDFSEKQTVYSFAYNGSMPTEVEKLTEADVNGSVSINTTFSSAIKAYAPVIEELSLELPSYLSISNVSSSTPYTQQGSKLVFKNVSTASNLKVNFTISKIDFTKGSETLGSISTANKKINLDADLQMSIKISSIVADATGENPANCKISANMTINNDMLITKVKGRFNPSISLDNLGSTNVSGIPDFLTNDGVVIDIDNPQILLNLSSDLDIPGFVGGTLRAIKDGKTTATVVIPEMNIIANGTSKICICRDKQKVDNSAFTSVVEVENLSEILNPIPDRIEFTGNARANNSVEANFELGKQYTIKPSYRIEAPLAFGKNAKIVYTDSFDDFNSDVKDLDVADGAYIEMTGDVENMIPAYLNASAVAIDVNGNELSQSEVKIDVVGEIAASEDGATAKTSPIKVTMTPAKGALKKLDGMKFTVSGSAKAESEDCPTVTGQILNAKKHSLVIKNIQIKFVGKAIADLN